MKRYAEGCNDHWCDLIDQKLGLNPTNRHQLTEWGDLDFKPIEQSNIICISSMFTSYSEFVRKYATEPETIDNR